MISFKKIAFVAVCCGMMLQDQMHAELLIVKTVDKGLAPLSDLDITKYGQEISQTLLKYQWPMCTSQDLTDEEKNELLTAGKPCAEELFIQKKLQEKIRSNNFDPVVIFIPTTLYELFCLDLLSNDDTILCNIMDECHDLYSWIDVTDELKYNLTMQKSSLLLDLNDRDFNIVYTLVHSKFDQFNKKIFTSNQNDTNLYINQLCIQWLFEQYPELKLCENGLQASLVLEKKLENITFALSENGIGCSYYHTNVATKHRDLIHTFLRIEYEARQQNKALLSRGTDCVDFTFKVKNAQEQIINLIGNTMRRCSWSYSSDPDSDEIIEDDRVIPYSISFGNSLFAGFIHDQGACAYHFLTENGYGAKGYVLFIDKKDYMHDRISHLFFIPSLNSLAGLLSSGEFFHPRGTAAVAIKKNETIIVKGILGNGIQDSLGMFLIQRDPLLHAEIFSDFIANNGKIIQFYDDHNILDQLSEYSRKLMINQLMAAQLYKQMRENGMNFNIAN